MTRRQRIEDLTGFALPGQPALSPDGREVVYVLTSVDTAADKNLTSLWLADTAGGNARRLTTGTADAAPAWSPDGTRIAFLRADGGAAQVWLLPAGGGEPTQVTSLPLGAGAPAWSPDGTKIAFGAPVDLHAMPGEDDAARAKRATAPVVTTRLDYKADGAGLLRTIRKHLHVLDLASGKVRQVTEGDWHGSDPVLVTRLSKPRVRRGDRARRRPAVPRPRLHGRRVRRLYQARRGRTRRRLWRAGRLDTGRVRADRHRQGPRSASQARRSATPRCCGCRSTPPEPSPTSPGRSTAT